MRVVFMGSPEFAAVSLTAVAAVHEVVLVMTQPDKPAGRGSKLTAPAVKVEAERLGLPVWQPASARKPEVAERLRDLDAAVGVVVAYGKILPPAVLTAFRFGCINVHGSILPKFRGAAPVQRAVIEGDAETGVSIMQLDEGMDTGPVFAVTRTAIGERETAGELMNRLAPIGAAALLEVLTHIDDGTARATAQDSSLATHAAMLAKSDGAIDFSQSAAAVSSRVRGVDPWPGAVAMRDGQPIKLFGAVVAASGSPTIPGTVVAIDREGAHVAAGADGAGRVVIAELQAAGRKRMPAAILAGGRGIIVGDVLVSPFNEALS